MKRIWLILILVIGSISLFHFSTDKVWINFDSNMDNTYKYIDNKGREYPCLSKATLRPIQGTFTHNIEGNSIDYISNYNHISAEIFPTYDKGHDMFGMHPTYHINKKGKRIWSNMEAEYIYIIPEKRWIEYHKRIGNKYLNNCIYIKLWKYRLTTDNTPYTFVVGKDFKFLYEYDYKGEFAWDKFDYSKLNYQDGKLFYKDKELRYDEQTNQLKLTED